MSISGFGKTTLFVAAAVLLVAAMPLRGQQPANKPILGPDSDQDGLSDALEQRLLDQFQPKFMVGEHDCSILPAEFEPGVQIPSVLADNGTIYGQVFPFKDEREGVKTVEIHFYHLWRKDCGSHGHPLDTEHVAVLASTSDADPATASWKAVYWYAAAHEDTVCDVSQIARASTLGAVDSGATVWISPGKHASYLNEALCQRGCGADRCVNMVPLALSAPINLGEPNHPANGALFAASNMWPLMAKMTTTNFPGIAVARLNQLPESDIAWFNPGSHPVQGVIAESSSTEQALAVSGRDTATAISVAADSTGEAISIAGDSTGGALQKTYRSTRDALGAATRNVGDALHITSPKKTDVPH
jgi:hypothetical protein